MLTTGESRQERRREIAIRGPQLDRLFDLPVSRSVWVIVNQRSRTPTRATRSPVFVRRGFRGPKLLVIGGAPARKGGASQAKACFRGHHLPASARDARWPSASPTRKSWMVRLHPRARTPPFHGWDAAVRTLTARVRVPPAVRVMGRGPGTSLVSKTERVGFDSPATCFAPLVQQENTGLTCRRRPCDSVRGYSRSAQVDGTGIHAALRKRCPVVGVRVRVPP